MDGGSEDAPKSRGEGLSTIWRRQSIMEIACCPMKSRLVCVLRREDLSLSKSCHNGNSEWIKKKILTFSYPSLHYISRGETRRRK